MMRAVFYAYLVPNTTRKNERHFNHKEHKEHKEHKGEAGEFKMFLYYLELNLIDWKVPYHYSDGLLSLNISISSGSSKKQK